MSSIHHHTVTVFMTRELSSNTNQSQKPPSSQLLIRTISNGGLGPSAGPLVIGFHFIPDATRASSFRPAKTYAEEARTQLTALGSKVLNSFTLRSQWFTGCAMTPSIVVVKIVNVNSFMLYIATENAKCCVVGVRLPKWTCCSKETIFLKWNCH